jgi:diketogulonate reductase-like aldo/keto reductase
MGPYGYNKAEIQEKPIYKTISAIAEKKGYSVAEVLLKWSTQKGVVPVSATKKKERSEGLLKLDDLTNLSDEEMKEIDVAGEQSYLRWTGWGTFRKTYDGPPGELQNFFEGVVDQFSFKDGTYERVK